MPLSRPSAHSENNNVPAKAPDLVARLSASVTQCMPHGSRHMRHATCDTHH